MSAPIDGPPTELDCSVEAQVGLSVPRKKRPSSGRRKEASNGAAPTGKPKPSAAVPDQPLEPNELLTDVKPPMLRIVAVNDVYELDNFPRLAAFVKAQKAQVPNVVATLAGDFLAPSLLSTVDHGKSMIKMMNQVPIDLVCFGNHEADICHRSVMQRIKEFQGKWLNGNMPGYEVELPRYHVHVLDKDDGTQVKIAFTGLCLGAERITYPASAFNGAAKTIVPVNKAAAALHSELKSSEPDVVAVIPLTHQELAQDIELARTGLFPAILGGHDHEQHVQQHGATHLIKAGSDALHAVVVDLSWPDAEGTIKVNTSIHPLDATPANPALQAMVAVLQRPQEELRTSVLYQAAEGGPALSSVDASARVSTTAAFLLDLVRQDLACDLALINSGCIRGEAEHTPPFQLTYAEILRECPFAVKTNYYVSELPGAVVAKAIKQSRAPWLKGEKKTGALQCDSGVVTLEDNTVTHINGKPIDPDALYRVATFVRLFVKSPALKAYAQDHPQVVQSEEAGEVMMHILVRRLTHLLWMELVDTDDNGRVSSEEMLKFVRDFDVDQTGTISRRELDAVVMKTLGSRSPVVVAQMMAFVDQDLRQHESKTVARCQRV